MVKMSNYEKLELFPFGGKIMVNGDMMNGDKNFSSLKHIKDF